MWYQKIAINAWYKYNNYQIFEDISAIYLFDFLKMDFLKWL